MRPSESQPPIGELHAVRQWGRRVMIDDFDVPILMIIDNKTFYKLKS
jgi:hypothetical protein